MVKLWQDTLDIPDNLKTIADGGEFLQLVSRIDDDELGSILMFMCNNGADVLRTCRTWSVDGTFSTSPQPFVQVVILQGLLDCGRSIPAGFGLLPSKAEAVYSLFWTAVNTKVGDTIAAKRMVLDIERANINAFIELFPTFEVTGWNSISVKLSTCVQKKKLVDLYYQSPEFLLFLSMIYLPANVPPADIFKVTFKTIMFELCTKSAMI